MTTAYHVSLAGASAAGVLCDRARRISTMRRNERRRSQIAALCLSGQVKRDGADRLATAVRAGAVCREFSATDPAASGD